MAEGLSVRYRIGRLLDLQKSMLTVNTVEVKRLVSESVKIIEGVEADPDNTEKDLLIFKDELAFLQYVLDALSPECRGAVDVNPKVSYVRIVEVPPEILIDAFRSVLITRLLP